MSNNQIAINTKIFKWGGRLDRYSYFINKVLIFVVIFTLGFVWGFTTAIANYSTSIHLPSSMQSVGLAPIVLFGMFLNVNNNLKRVRDISGEEKVGLLWVIASVLPYLSFLLSF